MSDPYANTVTVRNILNHILSPKVVSDGNGGYTTKVDLVNIDNIVAGSITAGSSESTDRSGVFTFTPTTTFTTTDSVAGFPGYFYIPTGYTMTASDISFVQVMERGPDGNYNNSGGNEPEIMTEDPFAILRSPLCVISSRVITSGPNANRIEVITNNLPADDTQFAWFTKRISAS